MLEASNLGQIIGRARYGVLERRPQPELVASAEAARRYEEQRLATAAERAAEEAAERRRQEHELDEQRAARQRAEREAAAAEREARAQARRTAAEGAQAKRPAEGRRRQVRLANGPKRAQRAESIRLLLQAHPAGLRSPELAAKLGITSNLASAHLCAMADVEKSGEYGRYVYRLKITPQEN